MKKLFALFIICAWPVCAQISFTGNQQWSGPNAFGAGSPPASGGGGGGGNNIAFRSKTFATTTAASVTATEPSGAAQNDVMVAVVITTATSTSTTIPSGWTSLASGVGSGGAAFDGRYSCAWIRRGASAPALTWTFSTSVGYEIQIVCYSGCTTSGNPYEAFTETGAVNSGAAPNCPSVTTLTANSFVLALGCDWAGSGSGGWGIPSGYTVRSDTTTGDDVVISEKKVVSPGAEDPATYSNRNGSSTTVQWAGSLALKSS